MFSGFKSVYLCKAAETVLRWPGSDFWVINGTRWGTFGFRRRKSSGKVPSKGGFQFRYGGSLLGLPPLPEPCLWWWEKFRLLSAPPNDFDLAGKGAVPHDTFRWYWGLWVRGESSTSWMTCVRCRVEVFRALRFDWELPVSPHIRLLGESAKSVAWRGDVAVADSQEGRGVLVSVLDRASSSTARSNRLAVGGDWCWWGWCLGLPRRCDKGGDDRLPWWWCPWWRWWVVMTWGDLMASV